MKTVVQVKLAPKARNTKQTPVFQTFKSDIYAHKQSAVRAARKKVAITHPNHVIVSIMSKEVKPTVAVAPPSASTPDRTLKNPVEIIIKKSRFGKRYHLRITGGNHKIRFHSQTYYSHFNAVRAALDASADLGLVVREDGDVVSDQK